MKLRRVTSKAELTRFIELPYRLYRDDPVWIPPLRTEQRKQVDRRRNPMLDHCSVELFLAEDRSKTVGRIAAFVDHLAVRYWGEPVGLFGSFECIDDRAASRLLLEAAQEWLRGQGMRSMRGPWSFASQEWGLVVEGFDLPPVIMAPHNPPWYNDHLLAFGLGKAKDLLVYVADTGKGYRIPARYLEITESVQRRYGITVRPVNTKRLEEEIAVLVEVANRSIARNWGFYPATEAEGRALARDIKPILDPDLVLIAEGPDGKPIGFAITLPDINVLLRGLDGRLLPFGWWRLLTGRGRLTQYRMWAVGVVPEYQARAVDAILYRRTHEVLTARGDVRVEANYILEDNVRMTNAMRNLGLEQIRRYRVYEMPI
ncbi:MAG: N-acetyltransferase [Acidobacteriia bacterium]|nr:N-acetyltransferase [Terriglobia bacterium]